MYFNIIEGASNSSLTNAENVREIWLSRGLEMCSFGLVHRWHLDM